MKNRAKQFKRLQGRWVLAADRYWDRELVYYKQGNIPTTDLLRATSWPTVAQAKRAIYWINLKRPRPLRWYAHKVKDTELFKEVLK